MPRDFTSIHICAKLCVSRYLQTDKPVDGQIETCMQYIYIYRYIYYILANLTTLEHILNLQRGIQLWLVFLSLQIDQSHALTSQTSQILAPGTRRSLLGSFHRMSWSQFEVFCLCPIDSTFLGPRQDSWENGMRLQETSRTGPREVASLELMRQNILYPEMLKAGNRL